jgi:acetyl esterase/lipase
MLKKVILSTVVVIIALFLGDLAQVEIPEEFHEGYKLRILAYPLHRITRLMVAFSDIDSLIRSREKADLTIKPHNDINIEDRVVNGVDIRVYYPKKNPNKTRPAFVYYHGGGYVFSHIGKYNNYLTAVSKRLDTVVVAVSYKKAPENAFPGPIEECFQATKYVFEHPNEFNIDPKKVIIAGDSAGISLVSV